MRLSDAAYAAVGVCGLDPELDRRPEELAYGKRRLVAIARAMACAPSVLLLDEPAAGLDDQEAHELAALVRTLADDWSVAILLVEHRMDVVMSICDRVTVLRTGETLTTGVPDAVQTNPAVLDAYLGETHRMAPA